MVMYASPAGLRGGSFEGHEGGLLESQGGKAGAGPVALLAVVERVGVEQSAASVLRVTHPIPIRNGPTHEGAGSSWCGPSGLRCWGVGVVSAAYPTLGCIGLVAEGAGAATPGTRGDRGIVILMYASWFGC